MILACRHLYYLLRALILITLSIALLGATRSPLVTRYIGYTSYTINDVVKAVVGHGIPIQYKKVYDKHDHTYLLFNSIIGDWVYKQWATRKSGQNDYFFQRLEIRCNNTYGGGSGFIKNAAWTYTHGGSILNYQADSLSFIFERTLLSLRSTGWWPEPVPILTSSHALAHFLDQNWAIGEHYDYSIPFPFLALWAMYLTTVALAVRIRTRRRGWAVSWPIFLNAVRCVPWWVVLIPAGWYFVLVFWAMMPYDHRYIDWRYRFESEPFSLAALSIGVVLTYAFSAEHAVGRALVMEERALGASPPACTVCGYPLDGRSVCPECGPVSPRAVSRARSVLRRPGVLRWAVLGFFALGPVWIAGVLWAI